MWCLPYNYFNMNDLEFDILDSIYFVESFDTIVSECSEKNEHVIADAIKQMIAKRWVQVMEWSDEKNEFVKTYFYDTDNMRAYQYLCTREGLMAHNSR